MSTVPMNLINLIIFKYEFIDMLLNEQKKFSQNETNVKNNFI